MIIIPNRPCNVSHTDFFIMMLGNIEEYFSDKLAASVLLYRVLRALSVKAAYKLVKICFKQIP